ncbi:MAG: tetratricopeptide repeat protein [Armatimonadetes bacterium]|nr:tetratricopeptide repeat protein [Armatimonadota bacterium]
MSPRETGYPFHGCRTIPTNELYCNFRGNAYMAQGDYGRALTDFRDAIKLGPKMLDVLKERRNCAKRRSGIRHKAPGRLHEWTDPCAQMRSLTAVLHLQSHYGNPPKVLRQFRDHSFHGIGGHAVQRHHIHDSVTAFAGSVNDGADRQRGLPLDFAMEITTAVFEDAWHRGLAGMGQKSPENLLVPACDPALNPMAKPYSRKGSHIPVSHALLSCCDIRIIDPYGERLQFDPASV